MQEEKLKSQGFRMAGEGQIFVLKKILQFIYNKSRNCVILIKV